MLALMGGQAQAVAEKTFHQNDDVTAVGRPHAGFVKGQRDMVVRAALAATDAGKMGIHGGSATRLGQRARGNGDGFLPLFAVVRLWKQVKLCHLNREPILHDRLRRRALELKLLKL